MDYPTIMLGHTPHHPALSSRKPDLLLSSSSHLTCYPRENLPGWGRSRERREGPLAAATGQQGRGGHRALMPVTPARREGLTELPPPPSPKAWIGMRGWGVGGRSAMVVRERRGWSHWEAGQAGGSLEPPVVGRYGEVRSSRPWNRSPGECASGRGSVGHGGPSSRGEGRGGGETVGGAEEGSQ